MSLTVDRGAEAALPYGDDPGRDFAAELDRLMPRWTVAPYATHPTLNPGTAYADHERNHPREVIDPIHGTVHNTPFKRYIRALDPAGNICSLIVSSVRPTPEFPDGDDGIGTEQRVVSAKMRSGWLILEPGHESASFGGRQGRDYLAWAFAVRDFRRARHAEHMKQENDSFKSQLLQALEKDRKANREETREMVTDIAKEIGVAVGQAVARSSGGGRGTRERTE